MRGRMLNNEFATNAENVPIVYLWWLPDHVINIIHSNYSVQWQLTSFASIHM